ncbi:MAG: hypothetical protein ABI789_08545 [Usitatibacter sp.]
MKRIVTLMVCGLISSAFAETGLKLQNDARGVPHFVGRHIHGKCGDLDVFDRSIIGTISGHTVAFNNDDSGVTTLTLDGYTTTGYADASGRPTHLIDSAGRVITPLTLTPEQAQAAVQRSRANLAALLDSCGMVETPATKCLAVNNYNAPNPGDSTTGQTSGAGAAHTKSCLDEETSSDFWDAYFASGGYFDTSSVNFDTSRIDWTLACMQAQSACFSICDNGAMAVGVICGIVATQGTVGALVGTVCAIADYAHWTSCRSDCLARYPC